MVDQPYITTSSLVFGQSQQQRHGQHKMTVKQSHSAVQTLNGKQNTSLKQPIVLWQVETGACDSDAEVLNVRVDRHKRGCT